MHNRMFGSLVMRKQFNLIHLNSNTKWQIYETAPTSTYIKPCCRPAASYGWEIWEQKKHEWTGK